MIRIVIYEDNENYRRNLVEFLNTLPDFRVVGDFPDCRNLVEQISLARPDLVLLDIEMPHLDGLKGLALLKQSFPLVQTLMLTIFDDDNRIWEAICLGANGYLLKHTPPVKLYEAIREVMEGGAPMTPLIARKVLNMFPKAGNAPQSGKFDLTEKELQVLKRLVEGDSYKMIADNLNASTNTIRTHIKSIYHKLHVHSSSEAISKALRNNIV